MIKLRSRAPYTEAIPSALSSPECEVATFTLNGRQGQGEVNGFYNQECVKTALKTIHGNKCAYCEAADTDHAAPLQVDHYRPKKKVKEAPAHTGYYWLAYEWSNLLLSCSRCNRHKSNHFPLWMEGEWPRLAFSVDPDCTCITYRMLDSHWLQQESRLLLHPELDAVERFFIFKANGTVCPVSDEDNYNSARAATSMMVYDLNRHTLILARAKKIDKYWTRLVDILNDFEDNGAERIAKRILYHDLRKYFRDMLQEQNPEEPFSRLGFFMFDHFQEFYLERLLSCYPDASLVADFYQHLLGR